MSGPLIARRGPAIKAEGPRLAAWPRVEQSLESQPDERVIHSLRTRLNEAADDHQYLQERDAIRDLDALGGRKKNQRVDRSHAIARVLAA
jgi:hypothetical protein